MWEQERTDSEPVGRQGSYRRWVMAGVTTGGDKDSWQVCGGERGQVKRSDPDRSNNSVVKI